MKPDTPLLDVKDLRTWFPIRRGILSKTVGYVRAVDGVSIRVGRAGTLGLVGESGCGKTTLARTILRLDTPRSGKILFQGTNLLNESEKDLRAIRNRLQIIFQDPFSSLNPRMTTIDIITEGLVQNRMISRRDREQEGTRLLKDVGLGPEALHRYPHEFSGGQRQRVSIARAIAMRPRLVICDEAVSALDVSVQAQVVNLLMDLRDKYHLSYLFISHDISVVRHVSDRIAVMYLGEIVEEGPGDDVIDAPRHPYTRALISAVPRVGKSGVRRIVLPGGVPSPVNPPDGCRFHPRCSFATSRCRQVKPSLGPVESGTQGRHVVACIRKNDI